MDKEIKKLNRFTTIPFLIDMLAREKLTLLNPGFWEDANDRETIEIFRNKTNAKSVYALCLTHESETVHHWNAFANGTSGCCIEFSPEKLFEILKRTKGVSHGKATYMTINKLGSFSDEQLPYFKRIPFKPEKEYRIIATSNDPQVAAFDIDIELDAIRKITISNKVPKPVFTSLKKILLGINPDFKGKVYHSTLFNNQIWINHFKGNITAEQKKKI
jgi:hypothetical protein